MSTKTLRLGLSPCPNDTFIFHALLHGLVDSRGLRFTPVIEDVETLNQIARKRTLDATKISFHAYGHLRDSYELLSAGAALGRGCGPLLVCRAGEPPPRLAAARIAIPGFWTSATLLLCLFEPQIAPSRLVELPFERIPAAVAHAEVDAGLIIHESRFTYRDHGLDRLVDLGAWWEEEEDLPIPLGGIIADRRLGPDTIGRLDDALRASVLHAREHPEDSRPYIRAHAQELADTVLEAHIALYVNEFTVDLGAEGRRAVDRFFARAEAAGLLG